ncbi:hypothetical protein HCN44_001222 [Aphidius gifuensis]|uniref:Uncharacterized protein n=1 Tax=Aphidius gifuensis TaxID=684658 RepID=A0A835CLD1_APHGI|nr:hypothetical protein HCN44_001222 [Aphidius gifuensis]
MEDADDSFIQKQLHSWNLDNYIEIFKSNGILNKQQLLKINPDTIRNIFFDSCSELDFWRKWAPFCASNALPEQHDGKDESCQNVAAIRASLHKEITKEKLMEIIQRHHLTRSVFKSYEQKQNLEHDTIIVEVIVSDLVDISSQYWNNEHFEVIANNIVDIFKSETKDTYYIAPERNRSVMGKIPDRFRNFIQKCRDISGETRKRGRTVDFIDVNGVKRPRLNDKSVEDSVSWLKNSNGAWDELQLHWQNSYQYRMSWMKMNDTKTADTIFQEWPVLQSPYAIELILQDFDQMIHLDVKGTMWNWPKFVEYLRGMKKSSGYDTGGRTLLEFLHLVHLFPPKGNNSDFKKKNKRQSCTIAEMQNIKRGKMEDSDKTSIEPYIIGVGQGLEKATEFYVILDNHEYQVKSGLEAIDLCFKIYHVMFAEYPAVNAHIWQLIERGVYKFHSRTKKIPNMEKFYKAAEDKNFLEISDVKSEVVYLL